ncbi:MAG: hypothetical protein Q8L88_15055 [Bacteroidota bacterium]|nr:hypothetical protein [Bacteroidota bacterium]
MKNFEVLMFLLLGIIGIFISCEDTITNSISNIDKIVFPESNIDYYKTIQPLFNIGCAIDGCHDVKTKASDLDLSSYESLMLRPLVVLVQDTISSRLIWYIDGRLISTQWHRPLNSNQVHGFKIWIMEGATDTIKTK